MRKLTNLWLNESRQTGAKYLGAKINETVTILAGSRIGIFKNENRASDKDAEYRLVVIDEPQAPQTEDKKDENVPF